MALPEESINREKNIKIILEGKVPVFIEWHQMIILKTHVGQQGLLLVSSGHWGLYSPQEPVLGCLSLTKTSRLLIFLAMFVY